MFEEYIIQFKFLVGSVTPDSHHNAGLHTLVAFVSRKMRHYINLIEMYVTRVRERHR